MAIKLELIFGVIGDFMSLCVFLVPILTFRDNRRQGTVRELDINPYLMTILSTLLWGYYGLLGLDYLILVINIIGCIIETMYTVVYMYYATNVLRVQTLKKLGPGLFSFTVFAALTSIILDGDFRSLIVGWTGSLFSLCVFASPFLTMVEAFRTRNPAHMTPVLSLFMALTAGIWSGYGAAKRDVKIVIPNVAGVLFCILQIVVFVVIQRMQSQQTRGTPDALRAADTTGESPIDIESALVTRNPADVGDAEDVIDEGDHEPAPNTISESPERAEIAEIAEITDEIAEIAETGEIPDEIVEIGEIAAEIADEIASVIQERPPEITTSSGVVHADMITAGEIEEEEEV